MIQPISTFELTSSQTTYLDARMQAVSRSFALVVPWLETPLNYYLATAYLLCRVVDNIEDCLQPTAWKHARFSEAVQLLELPDLAIDILARWEREDWPGLTAGEAQLMGPTTGGPLWQIYAAIPTPSRQVIHRWVLEMITGMSRLDAPDQRPIFVEQQGILLPAEEADYNQYCYVVAGTVGHLATELVIEHYRLPDAVANTLLQTCEACGRGLQKTNIVKDFAEDLTRGAAYLPDEWLREVDYTPLALHGAPAGWSRKVLDNVLAELDQATTHVLALSYHTQGYRMAGLMCLLPALQTIRFAANRHDKLFTTEHQVKISRQTMARCVWDAKSMVSDNDAVVRYTTKLKQEVQSKF